MNILLTGADRPLGKLAAAHLGRDHRLRLAGSTPELDSELPATDYRVADLRVPDEVAPLVAGMDAVLHLDPFAPAPVTGADAEQERLDIAARGTYVLLQMASEAGVNKAIVASTMALFESYPKDYMIDDTWQPQPSAQAESLAPWMSELTAREFARQGELDVICLRFGTLGVADGTAAEDVARALTGALGVDFHRPGYRWCLFHVVSGGRFATERGPFPLERSGRVR